MGYKYKLLHYLTLVLLCLLGTIVLPLNLTNFVQFGIYTIAMFTFPLGLFISVVFLIVHLCSIPKQQSKHWWEIWK